MLEKIYAAYILTALASSTVIAWLTYKGKVSKKLGLIHFIISFWSGLVTLNYLLEFVPVQQTLFFDWVVTTPLLVIALGLTVIDSSLFSQDKTILAALLQIGVICTGYLASAQGISWFWLGSVFLAGVFYLIVSEVSGLLGRFVVSVFFLIWLLYPVFFYQGFLTGSISYSAGVLGIYITAVFSKQVFAFVDLLVLDESV